MRYEPYSFAGGEVSPLRAPLRAFAAVSLLSRQGYKKTLPVRQRRRAPAARAKG